MTALGIAAAVAIIALIALLLYWQLGVAEGAYLGPRVVAWLYDRFAPRYDRAKGFDLQFDALMLADPILDRAGADARVLDVACGTGRLAAALFARPRFTGTVTAVDVSTRMLAQAEHNLRLHARRIVFARHDAITLPYDDASFDAVTCLEALEFMSDPAAALSEMARVLRPGGVLTVSNRIGPDVWKMPGLTMPTLQLVEQLASLGLQNLEVSAWLVDYDLVRGMKPSQPIIP